MKTNAHLLLLTFFAPFVLSCTIDQNYSVDKFQRANPDMTLFEDGITVPVDTTLTLKMSEIIKTDQIKADSKGDLFVDIDAPGILETSFSFPSVELSDLWTGSVEKSLPTAPYAGKVLSGVEIRDLTDFSGEISLKMGFALPQEIVDVKSIDVTIPLSVIIYSNMSHDTGAPDAILQKGSSFTFPKGFRIEKNESSENWFTVAPASGGDKAEGPYKITVTEDRILTAGQAIKVDIRSITVQNGWITGRTIDIGDQSIDVRGILGLKGPGVVPETFKYGVRTETAGSHIDCAEVKVDSKAKFKDQTVTFTLPEILRKGSINLMASDSEIEFDVRNESPVAAKFSGIVTACQKGISATFNGIPVSASDFSVIKLNEHNCPGLNHVINSIPDEIGLKDAVATLSSDEFITLDGSREYSIDSDCKIHIPLTLGIGTAFNFISTINTEAVFDRFDRLNCLIMGVDIINDSPIDLSAEASTSIDGEQVRLRTQDERPISVKAGEVSSFDVVLSKKDGSYFKKIGDIILDANAVITKASATFNAEDNVSLKIRYVSAPNGITIAQK